MLFVLAFTVAVAITSPSVGQSTKASESNAQDLESRLKLAGDNRPEMDKAIQSAPEEHRAAVKFLIANMPRKDLESLTADFLLENVRLAYHARQQVPWSDQVSESLFFNDVLPYAHVDETRERWRGELFELSWPIVKNCKSPGEAAQELNKHLFGRIQVKYSTRRKKANQSPSESIDQGLASCTGLSILLADACRSVNVPARLAGIPSWTNKRGNHTWVEVWDDGRWHFTGAAEYNAAGLNKAWFAGDAALADKSKRLNSIYAISFGRTDTTFPMVWSRDPDNAVYAVNVTDRYTSDAKPDKPEPGKIFVRFRVWNSDRTERVATQVQVQSVDSPKKEPLSGISPKSTADMNDMLQFTLDSNTSYRVLVKFGSEIQSQDFRTTGQQTQLVEIVQKSK